MVGYTYFGKQKLCYTEVSDFTDIQGIGHDPIYKRYDSVFSVIKRAIPTSLQHFLATPEYLIDEDQICWHIEKWIEYPNRLTDLSTAEHDKYKSILEDTVRKYKSCIKDLNGEDSQIMAGAIKYIDDDRVFCCDEKVYLVAWGMTPDTKQHKVIGSVIHEFAYVKKYKINFDAGENGRLVSKLDKCMSRAEGYTLSQNDLPHVTASDGWLFDGWSPSPICQLVTGDLQYTAKYIKEEKPVPPPDIPSVPLAEIPPVIPPKELEEYFTCKFDKGEHGTINGSSSLRKLANTSFSFGEIPEVIPNKGYKFKGWDINPLNSPIVSNKIFNAVYEKNIPWYRRWWLWLIGTFAGLFTGKGCLKWLLWILLAILLFLLFSWLLRGCVSCSDQYKPINGVVPVDSITRSDGRVFDDNGYTQPITGDDGVLPDAGSIVAPVLGEGGADIPIVSQPGVPNTIANRLFLFMEDENGDVESLAKDFKKAYPGNQYSIIGYDREVKLLVIQIPENERDKIRQTINGQIPNHKFIVFDEEIYELNGQVKTQSSNTGWHLKAINLQAGWAITKGSPSVKIAIVDDGIDPSHPMFKGRIVDAYNVFTQDNKLSLGEGHGTHTAGLAAGSAEYFSKGASGVAPGCMLMPIQVFDNKHCSLSSIVAGVMYAVHHDADVVNISIGPSFKDLNMLPVEQQEQIARQQFKNVEKLWARLCTLAAKKNCILVFAAGNDDILSSVPPENRNQSSIVVTAVDKNLYPTNFTNYGPCSDISAPGKEIYSSFPRGSFQSCDGTSMAAPIVAGTIALMKSLKKDLTVLQARNVLYKTGADVYGNIPPMVLVDKALAGVQCGDFSVPNERQIRPVPDGNGDDSAAGKVHPVQEVDAPINQVPPQLSNETDYDAIRRQIDEYKKKIGELEKLLPNKK
jgi:subtilisin family serine protease